jgi:hypothetical protein
MIQLLEYNEFRSENNKAKLNVEVALLESSVESDSKFNLAEEEKEIIKNFLILFAEKNVTGEDIKEYIKNPTNEGVVGSIVGGIAGFALGKSIGNAFAKVLGVQKGILYDLFTSRLVSSAVGFTLGKRI